MFRDEEEIKSVNTLLGHITLIPGKKAFYCLHFYSRNSPVCKHFCYLLNVKNIFICFQIVEYSNVLILMSRERQDLNNRQKFAVLFLRFYSSDF